MEVILDSEARFLEKLRPYLRTLAVGKLKGVNKTRFDESDITQKAIISAHENRLQWKGSSLESLKAWLNKILTNTILNEIQQNKAQIRDYRKEVSIDNTSSNIIEFTKKIADSPSKLIELDELSLLVDRLIDELPDDQRHAFILVRLEILPTEEVAKIMGKSRNAIGGLVFRGLETLREQIDSYLD